MPKIIHINVTAGRGSTGTIADEIGELLITNGWESWIAYGREPHGKTYSNIIKIGDKFDIIYHGFISRIFDRHGLGSKRATRKLIKRIKEIKPDIIHIHNLHGYFINYVILFEYLDRINIPVVWTFHDCWPMTGHCTHFMNVGCEKWMTECNNCPLKHGYPASYLLDRSFENFQIKKNAFTSLGKRLTIVGCSNAIVKYVKKSFLSECNITQIYNGIDLDIFKPQTKTKQKYIIGVAGKWSKRKGIDDFIKLRQYLPPEYKIVMVGVSRKQIRALPNGIQGIERVANRHELAKLYSNAIALINTTYADSFPTVNLEALACGTPVVTYNTGGSPEAVDSSTGVIVNQGDIEGLVHGVLKVLNFNPNVCRQRAIELFNKRNRYLEYFELYKTLINS